MKKILYNENYLKLCNENHHGTTRYAHNCKVRDMAVRLYKKRDNELIAGALLHDFFFDNQDNSIKGHSKVSLNNARQNFITTPQIEHIILSHMWPVAGIMPKTKRAWCVNIADKIVSIKEWLK